MKASPAISREFGTSTLGELVADSPPIAGEEPLPLRKRANVIPASTTTTPMSTSSRLRFGVFVFSGAVPGCGVRRTDNRSAIPGAPKLLDASDIDFSLKI
jgi:hypothetical protein